MLICLDLPLRDASEGPLTNLILQPQYYVMDLFLKNPMIGNDSALKEKRNRFFVPGGINSVGDYSSPRVGVVVAVPLFSR